MSREPATAFDGRVASAALPLGLKTVVTIEDDGLFIAACIAEELPIEFWYEKVDGTADHRTVSPYELRETAQGVRLLGYDHGRDGIRQYAPEGIGELQIAGDIEFRYPL